MAQPGAQRAGPTGLRRAEPWRAAVLAADVVFELFDHELLLGNNHLERSPIERV
jgi:hypothetical protein